MFYRLRNLRNHIPNIITLLNLLFGCLSIAWASHHYFGIAAIFIFLAAIMDFLDGLAANLLKAHSRIGTQLDSLADMVSFGVAPAFLVFINVLLMFSSSLGSHPLSSLSWNFGILIFLPFILSIFAGLRLAKFNIDTRQKAHFIGLPTPAMALFFASAVYLFQTTEIQIFYEVMNTIFFWDGFAILFSILMVSEIKMISLKFRNVRWTDNQFQYLFIGISVILLVSLQAMSIPIIILMYVIFSFVYHLCNSKH
ncbi:MAG: CDP-alcohol phosphatidyltransferase family protein [Bacteroidales bacterium]|nr:CDP-alcohol phosphatidyltransferase family protein [Bacteroidales bacterium]